MEKRRTPFSRFGRDGEEGQRWMPFSKLTRPRFGKRVSSEENIVVRDLDLADHGVRQRFEIDGEEGQRWMPFSMMTRPRFGKRTSSEENIVGRVLDLAEHGVRQRFGRKKLDLEF